MPAKKIKEIDEILKTKNLTPFEREMFLRRRQRYAAAIQRQAKDDLKYELRTEADKRIERDLPALTGESLSGGKFQGIRKFHPNINYDMDSKIRLRPVKKPISKI